LALLTPLARAIRTMCQTIEANSDNDEHSEAGDSAFSEAITDTTSLKSSIYNYEVENGRTYHSFHAGKYHMPNDEGERDRMDLHYHALRLSIENKPFHAPVKQITHVLDVGTGTGIWAMDVADEYPQATVVGFDLSPIQPTWVPPNLLFEICDADEEWSYPVNNFDLVHTRFMNGFSLKSWPHFYQQAYSCLKPGGWVENQEFDLKLMSDDDTIPANSSFLQWTHLWNEGIANLGATGRCDPEKLKSQMSEAGFINVKILNFKMPIGVWPKDPQLKEAGLCQYFALSDGLHGMSAKVFNKGLGWSLEELEVLIAKARAELKDTKIHSYWPTFVIIGQKPALESVAPEHHQ
jgi:cyclopropane fatty-acyl-phospholipid synthase-like methyltransferase